MGMVEKLSGGREVLEEEGWTLLEQEELEVARLWS